MDFDGYLQICGMKGMFLSGFIWRVTMDGMTMQLQWLVEIWVCHIQVHIHKDSAPLSATLILAMYR